jgi:hypothetical protein
LGEPPADRPVIVTNTATVLSARWPLTKAGVTNCDSAKWIKVRITGAASVSPPQSRARISY